MDNDHSESGRRGGAKTLENQGTGHFQRISRLGVEAKRRKAEERAARGEAPEPRSAPRNRGGSVPKRPTVAVQPLDDPLMM